MNSYFSFHEILGLGVQSCKSPDYKAELIFPTIFARFFFYLSIIFSQFSREKMILLPRPFRTRSLLSLLGLGVQSLRIIKRSNFRQNCLIFMFISNFSQLSKEKKYYAPSALRPSVAPLIPIVVRIVEVKKTA